MKRNDWVFLGVVVLVLAALGGGFLAWIHGFGSSGSATSVSGPAGASGSAGPAVAASNRLVIPSIGTDAPVIPEGASGPDGGALDVPSSVHVVAWWDGVWKSPSGTVHEKVAQPGQPGVALLAGHIDSAAQGHGALYRLQQVKTGAAVTVYGAKGAATTWKVTSLQVVSKSALPNALFVNSGPPRLAIVSCGGPFDASTGHYEDNVIAWAVPAT
ncbi:MAG: class F sortase [Actinobacteria bacterium]|nr:class F sortase [Actinomycetota bacterium]